MQLDQNIDGSIFVNMNGLFLVYFLLLKQV